MAEGNQNYMKRPSWLHYLWKIPLCGLLFFIGIIPGSQLVTWMGLSVPEVPAAADPEIVLQYMLLGTLIVAAGLAAIARGLSGSFLTRWLILFFFTWIAYGVNNYFEAAIFTTTSAASPAMVVIYFGSALMCAAGVAWLFPSDAQSAGFLAQARTFCAGRTVSNWAVRFFAAYLAFPAIYYFFGRLIAPIVLPYYQAGDYELRLPGWDQILPVLALRSLLFLLACLPILITWKLSNLRLFLSLGLALFILVGGINMLQAYWLTPVLRVPHTLEMFADEMVYAGALVLLLGKYVMGPKGQQIPVAVSR